MADNDQVGAGQSVNRSQDHAPKEELRTKDAKLERRRKFLIGGLATAPVIATLSSRPAWAGANCAFSDRMSDHMSEDTVTCSGDAVQYWQNNAGQLDQIFTVGLVNPTTNDSTDYSVATRRQLNAAVRRGDMTKEEKEAYLDELAANRPTLFRQVFRVAPPPPDEPDATMMQCLMEGALGGECVAAYCNASTYGSDYGYKPRDVVRIVRDGLNTDLDQLYGMLRYMNRNLQGPNPWWIPPVV